MEGLEKEEEDPARGANRNLFMGFSIYEFYRHGSIYCCRTTPALWDPYNSNTYSYHSIIKLSL